MYKSLGKLYETDSVTKTNRYLKIYSYQTFHTFKLLF